MPSTSEEIFSLTADLLIDGYVSASSGQIVLSETDLRVKGAQDLLLKRTYVPPHVLGRYDDKEKADHCMLGKALYQLETKGWVINPHLWVGYNNNSKNFQVRDPQGFVLEFQIVGNEGILKTSAHGCSNLRGEVASSSFDIRNIRLWIDGDFVKIIWPDGIERHYFKRDSRVYRLEKEFLTNGKIIQYEYVNQELSKIFSSDPSGKFVYASITKNGNRYLGSDGREVNFIYEKREIKGKCKTDGYTEKTSFYFPVMTRASHSTYVNSIDYNERSLLNSYDAKAYPVSCTYFQTKNEPARIQTFSNPSATFSFSYDSAIAGKKCGSTTVNHPDGAQTVYRFNQLLLLEAIENWLQGKLVNQKVFKYDGNQHIKSIETLDGEGNLLIAKRFECDSCGNPLVEKIEGDFGVFATRRKFDKNRVVFEENDDGLQCVFTYLGDTHLITSKTMIESGLQLRKTVYSYDEANNLVLVEEEGKTRVSYALYAEGPHLHLVEWEEKRDWDGQLIYQIHYGYDKWGNTCEEEHFGSDGKHAYTIQRTYNEKGELLDETNPLGDMAIYQYNTRGQCFYEEPFSNGLVIKRTFDGKGRLKILYENDYETRFDYNASDELTEKIDYLGYKTTYRNHPIHGKPVRIEESPSITEIIYDAFGREAERIDSYGEKTLKRFNSYGDVTKIIYPEKGEESFDYFPNGLLKSHTDPDGLSTIYSYDALRRIKEKKVGNYTTTFYYDGYHLYETIDPAGFITRYKYDLAGRKIEESREQRVTNYGYDSLGFLAWEERGGRRIEYINDLLGRTLKKSVDRALTTSWTYDAGGNVASIERAGITIFNYDAHNRLIEIIDPEMHKTVICYEIKPSVLLKKITNPIGIETVETYNPHGQLLRKEVAGETVEEFEYDKCFRINRQDHLSFKYTPNGNKELVKEANDRLTNWIYTPGNRLLTKQKPDGTELRYEYDAQKRLQKMGSREFQYDELDRIIKGTGFLRTFDSFGNITREEWSNGLWIENDYDDWDRPLVRRLPDQTWIEYHYEGPFLKKVTRYSESGTELYSQIYDRYDLTGNPGLCVGPFETIWEHDKLGRRITQQTPYHVETIDYDPSGNLIRRGNSTYSYDFLSQMTSESGRFTAKYDTHYNLQELNGRSVTVDALNQVIGHNYDPNGNLLKSGFVYDEFDQLVESAGERYIYDALGRRIQKGETSFLYLNNEEIGAFEQGKAKELKILGLKDPVAIEMDQKIYAPIVDVQGIIRLLIDWESKKIFKQNDCDAFGVGLSNEIPYAYLGKRCDPATGLIYFGKRYYDPSLRRWLTPDPIGPANHSNLYQYVFNNPYLYHDLNGEFAIAIPLLIWGAELALPSISACITTMAYTAVLGVVAYGGYKTIEVINKNIDVYTPDRPLPLTEDGIPIPEADVPHTELGTRDGSKGKYPQAREFDKDGNPVRDIDFTDHGYPKKHPIPHQHRPQPNPTGGTPKRGNPEPVPEWNYL